MVEKSMLTALWLALPSLALFSQCAVAGTGVLSPQGYGLVRFGMKVEETERALKQRTTAPYSTAGCDYVEFKKYPGLQFMVEDGIVTRADARRNIHNSAKVRVGMTLATVKTMHPSVKVEPHHYDDQGHYLILSTNDGGAAILFEESKGEVTDIRAGLKPAVEYVEGCL
jgi:hypothetical protein